MVSASLPAAPDATSPSSARPSGCVPAEKRRRHGSGPRIHDLRHTFAARTLLHWYRTGQDPTREMIKLRTYLGHAHSAHTYWYIEAVPELLALASQRAETFLAREARP
jgi:integrase/recombinase XerD